MHLGLATQSKTLSMEYKAICSDWPPVGGAITYM